MKWQLDRMKYCTVSEVDRIFSTCRRKMKEEGYGYTWKVTYMVINLCFCTGIRLSETKNLKHKDFDLESELPSLYVVGKGKRARHIPVSKILKSNVEDYIRWKKDSMGLPCEPHNYFFISPRGGKYSSSGLESMWNRAAREAGVHGRSFHSQRHTTGMNLYASTGANLKIVQQCLGHASTATSSIYSHVPWDQLHESVSKMQKRRG